MSFSQNVTLVKAEGGYYLVFNSDMALDTIFKKYGGKVNVTLTKPKDNKTLQQVKTIHALCNAWFFTGCHSAPDDVLDTDRFKLWCKVQFGKCSEIEIKGKLVFVPWSIADYSKDDLTDFIDNILKAIDMSGATSDKLEEIRKGMEENAKLNR